MSGYTGIGVKIFRQRVGYLRKKVADSGLDGIFLFSDEYRSGYTTYISDYKPINVIEESPQGIYIRSDGQIVLFLGAINAKAATRVSWISDIRDINTLEDFFSDLRDGKGSQLSIALCGEELLPTKYYRMMRLALKDGDYENWDHILNNMRSLKIKEEIQLLQKAAEIGDSALKMALEKLQEDEVTEIDLCAVSEYEMKCRGGDLGCATVLSSEINTETPTWRPTHKKIAEGEFVIIDVGPSFRGYNSDVAVTVVKGSANREQTELLDICKNIVIQTIDELRTGDKASRIYDLFLEKSISHNLADFFTPYAQGARAVGHSIGLDVVERPNLDKDAEFILEQGVVLALKYDLHGSEDGGLRFETVVVMEEENCKALNRILFEI
ncbi:MAG: M24 family metallopeptidase [Anaerolineaceae bacterium]|nr:M24 family metallopeptidase [Anaerolineaceae bacterium]